MTPFFTDRVQSAAKREASYHRHRMGSWSGHPANPSLLVTHCRHCQAELWAARDGSNWGGAAAIHDCPNPSGGE